MHVLDTVNDLRLKLEDKRQQGGVVGFVPTMGALHQGHVSLIETAKANTSGETDVVVVSIFVNPLQFGPDEDLEQYPGDLEQDIEVATAAGADIIFAPGVTEMYSTIPPLSTVSVAELSQRLEGASRPTHFDGVTTVVTKLFNIVGPAVAYFGEKDFQQLMIIKQLVADLSMPLKVIGCPTVRADDGLALSSRNSRLSGPEREAAVVLYQCLQAGQAIIKAGETSGSAITSAMKAVFADQNQARLDYATLVEANTLLPLRRFSDEVGPAQARLLVAAWLGPVRLIDNCPALPSTDDKALPSTDDKALPSTDDKAESI